MTMTLTEYINQTNPVFMPNVLIQKGEFEISWASSRWEDGKRQEYRVISMPALNKKYNGTFRYLCAAGSTQLWTMDEHGNLDQRSTFNLAEPLSLQG